MKLWKIVVAAGVLVTLCAAFLLVDFHAASSNTQSDNNTVWVSSGEQLPDAMQRKDAITLVVTGEGPFVEALQDSLAAQMREAGLGDATLAQEPGTETTTPVLVVELGNPNVFWTPFYSTGRFSVRAGYASNGDTSFLSRSTTFTSNENGPAISLTAEYNVKDHTLGVMSRPGYYHMLADWLSQQIIDALIKIYQPAGVAVP